MSPKANLLPEKCVANVGRYTSIQFVFNNMVLKPTVTSFLGTGNTSDPPLPLLLLIHYIYFLFYLRYYVKMISSFPQVDMSECDYM